MSLLGKNHRTFLLLYVVGIIWMIVIHYSKGEIIACPFRLMFGIPCLGCGMTRAMVAMMHGDLLNALQLNPNVVIVFPCMIAYPVMLLCDVKGKHHVLNSALAICDRLFCKWPFLITFIAVEGAWWMYSVLRTLEKC